MQTEAVDERFTGIDGWPIGKAVEAMWEGQMAAVAAIAPELGTISEAAEATARRLREGGRLIYAGAGTSGRVAVQDGVELGPTFGWPEDRLDYIIAGGMAALSKSIERAEDDAAAAIEQVAKLGVMPSDSVVGVAASGRTPFSIAALKAAKTKGALTIAIANNKPSDILKVADYAICAQTGSEVVAGSTRMKAGTAQKAILNIFSTAVMIASGRVYEGLMVDMIISNEKLEARGASMVGRLAGVDAQLAGAALKQAGGHIKCAVLIAMGARLDDAQALLKENNNILRQAVDAWRARTGKVNKTTV